MTIPGSSRPITGVYRNRYPCPRCGFTRQVKDPKMRMRLCGACKNVMTDAEIKEWEDQHAQESDVA